MTTQHDPQTSRQVPPAQALLQMVTGYRISQAIYVAAELDIADLLKDGPKSIDELAIAAGANPDALYRLLRALASIGVFAEVGPGSFTLTPLSVLLQTGIPGSLRAAAIYYCDERNNWRPWGELLYSVKTGRSAFEHVFGMGLWEYFDQHTDAGRLLSEAAAAATALTTKAVANAYDFWEIHTIVDVGGGHGALMAAILKAHPHLRGVVFDLPPVVEGAKQLMEAEGLVGRCNVVAGDFLKVVPGGGDAYVLKWVLHDWDDERAVAILKNCRRAMGEQGKLLVVESVIRPDNEPAYAKFVDLQMLVLVSGRERTEAQYRALFAAAGFTLTNILPTPAPQYDSLSIIEGVPV